MFIAQLFARDYTGLGMGCCAGHVDLGSFQQGTKLASV
jgi:hypothetical protein